MQLDQSVGSSSQWSGASSSVGASDTRWFPEPHCYEGRPGNDRWGWTRDRHCTTRRHRTWPRTADLPTGRCLRHASRTSCHCALSANHLPHHTAALQFYYFDIYTTVCLKMSGWDFIMNQPEPTFVVFDTSDILVLKFILVLFFCYKFYKQSFLFLFYYSFVQYNLSSASNHSRVKILFYYCFVKYNHSHLCVVVVQWTLNQKPFGFL